MSPSRLFLAMLDKVSKKNVEILRHFRMKGIEWELLDHTAGKMKQPSIKSIKTEKRITPTLKLDKCIVSTALV